MMKRMCPLGLNNRYIDTAERRDNAYKTKPNDT